MNRSLQILLLVAVFATACNSSEKREVAADSDNISALETADMHQAPKLVKTADLDFDVSNVRATAHKISTFTSRLGGMVTHQDISARRSDTRELRLSPDSVKRVSLYRTEATMTVRVPQGSLDTFLYEVSSYATFVNQSRLDIEDKSLDYLSASLRRKNRERLMAEKTFGKEKMKDAGALLSYSDEQADLEIGRRSIDRDVAMSTLSLTFTQPEFARTEIVANTDLSGFGLSFGRRLLNNLGDGLGYFLEFILVLSNIWVFLLLVAATWFGLRAYRKQKALSASRTIPSN